MITSGTGRAHANPSPHTEPAEPLRQRRGLLDGVVPNSPTHWALLSLGVAGSVLFTATFVVDGLLQPGYDSLIQPMSALSLGPDGWVQIANFVVFGVIGCVSAPAWRATLAGGPGATWYPRLRVVSGLALICAGVFTQDPGLGFPIGVASPAHPTLHAGIHQLTAYVSLTTTVAELLLLSLAFARTPRWRGWGPAALAAGVLMMALLTTFGVLISHGGPGGAFEKLASVTPSLVGIAVVVRLLHSHDARIPDPVRPQG